MDNKGWRGVSPESFIVHYGQIECFISLTACIYMCIHVSTVLLFRFSQKFVVFSHFDCLLFLGGGGQISASFRGRFFGSGIFPN